jgi:hypothetical protein
VPSVLFGLGTASLGAGIRGWSLMFPGDHVLWSVCAPCCFGGIPIVRCPLLDGAYVCGSLGRGREFNQAFGVRGDTVRFPWSAPMSFEGGGSLYGGGRDQLVKVEN